MLYLNLSYHTNNCVKICEFLSCPKIFGFLEPHPSFYLLSLSFLLIFLLLLYLLRPALISLHLPLTHVSNPISETIHVSPLITTIKKNKIVSLIFNVGLNIFTTPHLPYSLPHFTYML